MSVSLGSDSKTLHRKAAALSPFQGLFISNADPGLARLCRNSSFALPGLDYLPPSTQGLRLGCILAPLRGFELPLLLFHCRSLQWDGRGISSESIA